MSTIEMIKKAMKEKKLVIGYNSTIRLLKRKKVSLVVAASNAPIEVKKELKNLTSINKVEYVESNKNNLELGATSRKHFGVTVLSIKSEKE